MHKSILVFMLAFSLVAFSGCSKGCSTSSVACSIEQTVVDGVSPIIAGQLQCSNPAQIKIDLTNVVAGLNLCRQPAANGKLELPQPICSMVANLVLSGVAKLAIPSSWGCTAANAQALLSSVIVTACTSL